MASEDIIQQYMQLRSAYDALLGTYETLIAENSNKIVGLATLDEPFGVKYRYFVNGNAYSDLVHLSWAQILKIVGPNLYSPSASATISSNLSSYIHELNTKRSYITINEMDADTVKIHLNALGLLKIEAATSKGGGVLEYISLTEKGKTELVRVMAVRAESLSPT